MNSNGIGGKLLSLLFDFLDDRYQKNVIKWKDFRVGTWRPTVICSRALNVFTLC